MRMANLEQLKMLRENEPFGADDIIGNMCQDEDVYSKDMFEELTRAYLNGSDEFKHGMDKAMTILLWKDMQDIADKIQELLESDSERSAV